MNLFRPVVSKTPFRLFDRFHNVSFIAPFSSLSSSSKCTAFPAFPAFRARPIARTSTCLDQISSSPGSMQQLTSFIARVSNPKNQSNHSSAHKLLAYCIRHNHWSVFEHCHLTIEITTSRAIAAQILRHRSFVFQEFSLRYAEADRYCIYPARSQDAKNRQNSIDNVSHNDQKWFNDAQHQVAQTCFSLYADALSKGIAKEQARFLLPLNTQTVLYMTGNIRSWIHYIQLRASVETQKEHRDIALACKDILSNELPDVAKALNWVKQDNDE